MPLFVADKFPSWNTTILTKADVTDGVGTIAWTTANTGLTLFTVTGTVLCRVYGVTGAVAMTSTAGTGTLAVGVNGSSALFIPATTADGAGRFIAGSHWTTNNPTLRAIALTAIPLSWALNNAANILLAIATNNMTAGSMTLYCDWIPVSAGASVV